MQRSPKLRETLQQEALRVQAVEQQAAHAHQAHAAAVAAAQQVALHFTLGNFPELAGLTQEQIPAALHVLEHSNPQRFQQVVSQLAKLDQVSKANAEVQARQQQRVQQQVAGWVQAQDAEVDSYLAKSEAPETVRSVKDNIPRVLQHYGVDVNEFRQAIAQVPLLRSAPFQKMLFSLGKQFVLSEQAAGKVARPVPPVQRPGTSQPRSSYADAEVAAARERFLKNPDDLRVAAAYLTAKRNARS